MLPIQLHFPRFTPVFTGSLLAHWRKSTTGLLASVNVVCAVRPEAPVAVSVKLEPSESSRVTCHWEVNDPFGPALTGHGSCPSPPSAVPSLCLTCRVMFSFALNPPPVICTQAPGG